MLSLCYIVLYSDRLTSQQNEEEPVKMYPPGYKQDRLLAVEYATKIVEELNRLELLNPSVEDDLRIWLDQALRVKPNQQQRDLPEIFIDDADAFYHDNEHQYVQLRGSSACPWDGQRPKVPPEGEPCPEDWNDPALEEEFSEGEYIPEITF